MANQVATVTINEERCKGCALCVGVCPPSVLRLADDRFNQRGYRPIELAPGCTGCEMCYRICPDFVFEVYRGRTRDN
ncbi:MAG TPA: 4Fe-4S dicluster domain-containing protein [Dehalococcoidia bacterium]|nr:4Fe-4S dicluster domain-containing protein [Dehalococcoidia bacterium]